MQLQQVLRLHGDVGETARPSGARFKDNLFSRPIPRSSGVASMSLKTTRKSKVETFASVVLALVTLGLALYLAL